jgi:Fe-S oxidoreductase
MAEIERNHGARAVQLAQSADEAIQLTTARRVAFSALARVSPTTILEDATVPRSELANMIRFIQQTAAKYEVTVGTFGHMGDGNLHPTFLTNEKNEAEMARVEKAMEEIFDKAVKLGGTITGEHGVGLAKKAFLPRAIGADSLCLMRQLTGCVQDLAFSHVNRDTADALLANGCEVVTPRAQFCCGSIHAHNGEFELAKQQARRNLDAFDLKQLDAVITNAAGCGTHLKNYGHLLQDDPAFAERALEWSTKLRDIHEWLAEIGIRAPAASIPQRVTYHEACHLCHGQKITRQPRQVLKAVPGLELVELPESAWCCGSAGVYNITQPEMSQKLLRRKMANIATTGAEVVASANPGCSVQLQAGVCESNLKLKVAHPISLLAQAYRDAKHASAQQNL